MKKLCCDRDLTGCNWLKALLESEGIPCFVRNDNMASVLGGPGAILEQAWPEIWVINDDDFDKAWEILNAEPQPDHDADVEVQPE